MGLFDSADMIKNGSLAALETALGALILYFFSTWRLGYRQLPQSESASNAVTMTIPDLTGLKTVCKFERNKWPKAMLAVDLRNFLWDFGFVCLNAPVIKTLGG